MSLSGITALLQVTHLKAEVADQQAAAESEKQRQTMDLRSPLDELLSSSSVMDQFRSSNLGHPTVVTGQLFGPPDRPADTPVEAAAFDQLGTSLEVEYKKLEAECTTNIEALRDQISNIDAEIKAVLTQIHALGSEEQALKDSVAAMDESTHSSSQSRLEKAAQSYKDVLDSFDSLVR